MTEPERASLLRSTMRRLLHHKLFLSGCLLFGIILLAGVAAPLIAPLDPNKLSMRMKFRPPGAGFIFGTDNFGRSLWSRVVWGARLSMLIGGAVVAINAVLGTAIGAAAGYFRRLDNGLMRINDALMAFPAVLLAIGVTAVLGPSVNDVIIALAIVYTPAPPASSAPRSSFCVRWSMFRRRGPPVPVTGASCAATFCPTRWHP